MIKLLLCYTDHKALLLLLLLLLLLQNNRYKSLGFDLLTGDDKVFYPLAAESETEMEDWIMVLSKAIGLDTEEPGMCVCVCEQYAYQPPHAVCVATIYSVHVIRYHDKRMDCRVIGKVLLSADTVMMTTYTLYAVDVHQIYVQ